MNQIEEVLSQLGEGANIEFNINPHLFGLGPKHISARFVKYKPDEETMIYQRIFLDPVYCLGGKSAVDCSRISKLHKKVSGGTGPR